MVANMGGRRAKQGAPEDRHTSNMMTQTPPGWLLEGGGDGGGKSDGDGGGKKTKGRRASLVSLGRMGMKRASLRADVAKSEAQSSGVDGVFDLIESSTATDRVARRKAKGDGGPKVILHLANELIPYIYTEKLKQDGKDEAEGRMRQPLPEFVRDCFVRKYGLRTLALQYMRGIKKLFLKVPASRNCR